jgi:hypothetical protein
MKLAWIDVLLIAIYCAFVLAIGFRLRRQMVGSRTVAWSAGASSASG